MINEKTAYHSFIEALDAKTAVLDGRTELDRLKFLTDFADLINFYDQENETHGSWKPLLMKDPVFLLADIAKFNLPKVKMNLLKVVDNLDLMIPTGSNPTLMAINLNYLLGELMALFIRMERWAHYMHKYHQNYSLKKFLIDGIKKGYAAWFLALAAMCKKIEQEDLIEGIKQIDPNGLDSLDKDLCRKANKPFWQVIGLEESDFMASISDEEDSLVIKIWQPIKSKTNQLFDFLGSVIAHAQVEYQSLAALKVKFPDTALLRSFVKLQEIHTQVLNGLSEKHLNFYYQKVLNQSKRNALADYTFITAKLNVKEGTFQLPLGTRFNAGIGPDKKPIEFENAQGVNINSAVITNGYTLNQYSNPSNKQTVLYKSLIENPELLKKDKNGRPLSWKLFGGEPITTSIQEKSAFIIGSPILLLREGQRKISCQMTFDSAVNWELFKAATYSLSTNKDWLTLEPESPSDSSSTADNHHYQLTFSPEDQRQLTLEITLGSKAPGIETFPKNKEGIDCNWPMLKLEFEYFNSLSSPPLLSETVIEVAVSGVSTFSLYNDFGALDSKKAFPLFGPTPMPNDSFIIGSSEIFSKPLTALQFDLEWDGLPDDFKTYYLEYNVNKDLIPPTFAKGTTPEQALQELQAGPFNNACFTGQFEILRNKEWISIGAAGEQQLFSVTPKNELQQVSSFSLNSNTLDLYPDANIQQSVLTFNEDAKEGFVRLRLTAPVYGFGGELYGKVVSNVALKNAQKLMNKQAPSYPPANVPYVPKLKSIQASYSASQVYHFDFTPSAQPIDCFIYTLGKVNQVYTNQPEEANMVNDLNYTLDGNLLDNSKLRLHPALDSQGALFMHIANLSTPCELNLYFELARKVGEVPEEKPITYRFKNGSEWVDLTALSDGTKGFICSGIVKLSVPQLNVKDGLLCIGVPGDPEKYAHATLVNPNGIEVTRAGENYLNDPQKPYLKAGSIKAPMQPIPQLTSIKQPFDSTGGRGAENGDSMSRRVATQIKTKQRFVTGTDFYNLIQHHFPEVYYAKCVYDRVSKVTQVYVIKKFANEHQTGAFVPLVDINLEERLLTCIRQNSSPFANVSVSNFLPCVVHIAATVTVNSEEGLGQAQDEINSQLKLFLSPWITSDSKQLTIDDGLTEVQVLNFIKSIEGVISVSDIAIEETPASTPSKGSNNPNEQLLLVTADHHSIKCRHAI